MPKICTHLKPSWDNHVCCRICRTCSKEYPCDICTLWTDWHWERVEANRLRKLKERMARDRKKEKNGSHPPAKKSRKSEDGATHKPKTRVLPPETDGDKAEKELVVGDPLFKMPLDVQDTKSLKKSFELGPSGHSSPVEENSELESSSGGAASDGGYEVDVTVDESREAGYSRESPRTPGPTYGKETTTSGKMEAHNPKKRKKVVKSTELVESEEETDRQRFIPLLAERLRSRKEIQDELEDTGKQMKSVVSKVVSTPGKVNPGPEETDILVSAEVHNARVTIKANKLNKVNKITRLLKIPG